MITIPQKAIDLAVQAGWAQPRTLHNEFVVLDNLFWQALGRAFRWEKVKTYNKPCGIKDCTGEHLEGKDWKDHALRYFELKLTGGDEEKFWSDLIKK